MREKSFRKLPSKTLASKGEVTAPFDKEKVLGCCNASGTLKWKIMLIGKSKKAINNASTTSTSRVFIYITEVRKMRGWMTKFLISRFMILLFLKWIFKKDYEREIWRGHLALGEIKAYFFTIKCDFTITL